MEETLLFVRKDSKLKDVQNLERFQDIGAAYQIVMLEAVKTKTKNLRFENLWFIKKRK